MERNVISESPEPEHTSTAAVATAAVQEVQSECPGIVGKEEANLPHTKQWGIGPFRFDFIFNLIAGGALVQAFVPVFVSFEKVHGQREIWRLTSLVFNVLLVTLTGMVLIAEIVALAFVSHLLVPVARVVWRYLILAIPLATAGTATFEAGLLYLLLLWRLGANGRGVVRRG